MGEATTSEYRTAELGLAAYLLAEGHLWQRIERVSAKQCAWVFRDGSDLAALVEDYLTGAAEVEPKKFVVAYTQARDALFEFMFDGKGQKKSA